MNLISRNFSEKFLQAATTWPCITLSGPRQSGKTTLAKKLFPHHPYKNLESLAVRKSALEDPEGFLSLLPDGAILDEVQNAPDLLSYLMVLIDEDRTPGRWILTGSQNFTLLKGVSQSLAGRTAVFHLLPLTREEIIRFPSAPESIEEMIIQGSYPGRHQRQENIGDWYDAYLATYLQKDIYAMSAIGDYTRFQDFLVLCAGRTSQLLNYSNLADDVNMSTPTIRSWFSILEASFIVFRLHTFKENIRRQMMKMPKFHFFDTGLVCYLLGIKTPKQLHDHPLRGAIFESWVVSEIIKERANLGEWRYKWYYRDRRGHEIDLVLRGAHPHIALVEAKYTKTAPFGALDRAKHVVNHLMEAGLEGHVHVVYAGEETKPYKTHQLVSWKDLPSLNRDIESMS